MEFKSSGIIRSIDDLGRLVFPKVLRRTLQVKEGDPFEIGICEINGQEAFVAVPYHSEEEKLEKSLIAGTQVLCCKLQKAMEGALVLINRNGVFFRKDISELKKNELFMNPTPKTVAAKEVLEQEADNLFGTLKNAPGRKENIKLCDRHNLFAHTIIYDGDVVAVVAIATQDDVEGAESMVRDSVSIMEAML